MKRDGKFDILDTSETSGCHIMYTKDPSRVLLIQINSLLTLYPGQL